MVLVRVTPEKAVGEYEAVQQIGSGSFSVVWRGVHRATGEQVAIKEVPTTRLSAKLQESLESEIAILRHATHPNIVRLKDILKAPECIFLIMEYCAGGDLSSYIRKNGPVDELTAQHFMRQLGAGLQVLRANNLIHRDLKPQNLLLSEKSPSAQIKIADFGFARSLQPQGLAETLCGSPLYMAPEILQCQKYDAKADLWSVGAILFELVTGRPPFGGQNHVHLLQNIKRHEATVPQEVASRLSPSCMSLIKCLLKRNPVERLSFEEFFNHPFLGLSSASLCGDLAALDSPLAARETDGGHAHPHAAAPHSGEAAPAAPAGGGLWGQAGAGGRAAGAGGAGRAGGAPEPLLFAQDGPGRANAAPTLGREAGDGAGAGAGIGAGAPGGAAAGGRHGAVEGLQQEVSRQLLGLEQQQPGGDMAPPGGGAQGKGDAQNPSSSGSGQDSMEMLEREYVVVDPPSETASPQRMFHMSPSPSSSPSRAAKPGGGPLDPSSSPQRFFRASPSPSSSPSRGVKPGAGGYPGGGGMGGDMYRASPSPSSSPGRGADALSSSLSSSQELAPPPLYSHTQHYGQQQHTSHTSSHVQPHVYSPHPTVGRVAPGITGTALGAAGGPPPLPAVGEEKEAGGSSLRGPPGATPGPRQREEPKALPGRAQLEAPAHGRGHEAPGTATAAAAAAGSAEGGQEEAGGEHPAARLTLLRSSAKCISELALQKLAAGWQHEALSLQLLCLVTWREALRVCHAWAADSGSVLADVDRGPARTGAEHRGGLHRQAGPLEAAEWCDEVESEYLTAVTAGERVAAGLKRDDHGPVPDAAEAVYQAALVLGRAGAVEELMGKTAAAEHSYMRSVCLLQFLLWEAPRLPLSPPLGALSPEDQHRLQRYSDGVSLRRRHCMTELGQAGPEGTAAPAAAAALH